MYFFERNNFSKAETYSEPCQTNKMDHFAKKSQRLLVVNYFCKTLHLRCLRRFWIHLWKVYQNDCQKNLQVRAAAPRILSRPGFLRLWSQGKFLKLSSEKHSNGAVYDLLRHTKTCNPRFTELAGVLHNTEREKAPSDPSNVFLNKLTRNFFFSSHNICTVYCLRT